MVNPVKIYQAAHGLGDQFATLVPGADGRKAAPGALARSLGHGFVEGINPFDKRSAFETGEATANAAAVILPVAGELSALNDLRLGLRAANVGRAAAEGGLRAAEGTPGEAAALARLRAAEEQVARARAALKAKIPGAGRAGRQAVTKGRQATAAGKAALARGRAALAARAAKRQLAKRLASPAKMRDRWRGQGPGRPGGRGPTALAPAGARPVPVARPSEAPGGTSSHPIANKASVMSMAGRAPLSSLVRVSTPGGRLGGVKLLQTDADVPAHYRTDPKRFTKLAEDPDHAGQVLEKTRAEAMAGLEAEQQGLIKGPIVRGGKGIEYHDAAGTPYDVKAPVSAPVGETWPFRPQKAANSIIEELRKKVHSPPNFPTSPPGEYLNPVTNAFEPRWVILDSSYMNAADHAALWQELNKTLTPSEQGRIIEVNTRP